MAKLTTHGATMRCTLGATPAKLLVTSQSFRKISGAPVATENDKVGMTNVPSFGTCKCGYPNPPCVPSVQGWQQTTQKDSINGLKKLTENSFCMCAKGGRISFVDTGENTFVESE